MFILIYIIYIIGYTVNNVASSVMASVLTNDPKQRPMFNFVSTIFSYGVPILLSNVVTFNILPKYDNQYNMPMLKEMTLFYIAVSFVCCIVSMIGIAKAGEDWSQTDVGSAFQKQGCTALYRNMRYR